MKPIEIESRDGKLIFEDYAKREVSILEKNYLKLIADPAKLENRAGLEGCLSDPTEVWGEVLQLEGKEVTMYKYIKVYNNGVFVVFVLLDELVNFYLNNFYWFDNDELDKVDKLRRGIPVFSEN